MHITLFTYDRPKMLKQTKDHILSNCTLEDSLNIYNDGVTHEHRGKKGFWKTWNEALIACKEQQENLFVFMPEDFIDLDFKRLRKIHERLNGEPYVCNIINDGRHQQWRGFPELPIKDGLQQIGFTDCGFFCNREALEQIGFWMEEPPKGWFELMPNISSGVGMMLTNRLAKKGIDIFKPVKSLAYHGNHESKMHGEERTNNPLISK